MKKIILILFSILTLSSCKITESIWHPHYSDKIQDFVTTKGGGQIAFLGEKYDYIFDDQNGAIKRLLFWSGHDLLIIDTDKTKLYLDEYNGVSGYAEIKTAMPNLKVKDVAYLESLGFIRYEKTHWSGRLFLSGKRYEKNPNNYKSYSLGTKYSINIYYPNNNSNKFVLAGKTLISPITITLDAILWVPNKVIYDDN